MARNNYSTGKPEFGQTQIDWYRKNIKDEFQGSSYIDPPEGEEDINLIGKVYHSWNIVAMRRFFPIELIRLSVLYRQWSVYSSHGLGKIRADLQTLEDLEAIEKVLLKYS